MLQALKISYFEDLLDLEPGDRWGPRLETAIDQCDLFLLFWSSGAKRSKWVRKEVSRALQRQAGDGFSPPEIRPVILEGPPIVPPWEELSHLHFNDRLLYFMSPMARRHVTGRAGTSDRQLAKPRDSATNREQGDDQVGRKLLAWPTGYA